MNNLHQFLQFNQKCPICQAPLTLYMQWINSVCFKAKQKKDNEFQFKPFKCKNDQIDDDDYLSLYNHTSKVETRFSSSKMSTEAKRYQMYFFLLCNESGFKDVYEDYEINIHRGCYYRSTPIMEFRKQENTKHWKLENIEKEHIKLVNADEVFSFKKATSELEKVYMLQLNYTNDKTVFMHYAISPEQRKDPKFEPNIFEKELPILNSRPNLEMDSRDNLISRLDSWVILS
jgi:hypothetical protein